MSIIKFISISIIVALIILFTVLMINQVMETYASNDPVLIDLQKTLEPVHPIIKNLTIYKGKKSYTINKEKIYICLGGKDGKYYDKNTLIYVTLHEIAHVLCNEIGHTEKFNNIFDELLNKATKLKIFNPSIPIVQDYCP